MCLVAEKPLDELGRFYFDILDFVFLRGAGGPGNPCYGVQARLANFALKCES